MEFYDSYGFNGDSALHRLNNKDLESVLHSQVQRENVSVRMLADRLPELRKKASGDKYAYVHIETGQDTQTGWIMAQYPGTISGTDARSTKPVAVVMSYEGELWQGAYDHLSRTVEVSPGFQPYSVPEMAWLYSAYEAHIKSPLVHEEDAPLIASTLQNTNHGLEVNLDFLLNPRTT